MKQKGGMKGLEGARDETQGGNEGGSRGQGMKHKRGMKGARGGKGGNEEGSSIQIIQGMKHKGGMTGA